MFGADKVLHNSRPQGGGGKGGGGGGTTSTQTVQKADPWAGQQPYLQDIFSQAQSQYYGGQPQYYPGQTIAGFDPATQAAQNYLLNYANSGTLADTISGTQDALQRSLNAADVNNNPALNAAIEAAQRPTIQAFTEQILPNLGSAAQQAGAYGGSRYNIAQGEAAGRLAQTLSDTAATMSNTAYNTGLGAQIQALNAAPNVAAMGALPATLSDQVGTQRQAMTQAQIDDAINKWNFQQNIQAQKLAQYMSMVQGNYGGSASSFGTSQSPTARDSTLSDILGVGALGLGLFGGGGILDFLL